MRTFFLVVGGVLTVVALVVALSIILVKPASPRPLPEPPYPAPAPSEGPAITWSASQFTATLFPGGNSTTTVSFRSNQNLAGIVVWITPSLNGIVSAAPSTFPSVVANQDYPLTLTLKAPSAFQKRSFGGTIHIRNAGSPARTYDAPLTADLRTDFRTYSSGSVSIDYPVTWFVRQQSIYTVFSNVISPSPLSDTALRTESAFDVHILARANPSQLPIEQWFTQFFATGFSSDLLSETAISINGQSAVRIELAEIGRRVHVYIGNRVDVIEVTYGIDEPSFDAQYEAMLASLVVK
jgi:hypothetical protein